MKERKDPYNIWLSLFYYQSGNQACLIWNHFLLKRVFLAQLRSMLAINKKFIYLLFIFKNCRKFAAGVTSFSIFTHEREKFAKASSLHSSPFNSWLFTPSYRSFQGKWQIILKPFISNFCSSC